MEYQIPEEYSLGEAIWMSKSDDTLKINSGNHGYLILKSGVNVKFSNKSTVALIVPTGESKKVSITTGLSISTDNIKSLFIFRKKLPFLLRLKKGESFFHATGAEFQILGQDKEAFSIGGTDTVAESLPKSLVQIIVPRMESFDFKLIQSVTSISATDISITNITNNDDLLNFIRQEQKRNAEMNKILSPLNKKTASLPFNEVEYTAFWALNHFIRQYCKLLRIPSRDLSLAKFKDGLFIGYKDPTSNLTYSNYHQYIESFTNLPIDDKKKSDLLDACRSSPDYSVSEYIKDNLNHLNYSAAIIAMDQVIEHIAGLGEKKRKAILSSEIDEQAKQYLTEIILTRNTILHQGECALKSTTDGFEDAKETYGIEEMSEYRIYETYRPWLWYQDGLAPFQKYMDAKKKT